MQDCKQNQLSFSPINNCLDSVIENIALRFQFNKACLVLKNNRYIPKSVSPDSQFFSIYISKQSHHEADKTVL